MPPPTTVVYLVGMMGAGKSTLGERLAERLGWTHLDTDRLVEESMGMDVAAIFATRGEVTFRRVEAQVLGHLLNAPLVRHVISVAGGAVLDAENRRRLVAAEPVIWLRARPESLLARLGAEGGGRPLLAHGPATEVDRLDNERRPVYGEVADIVVDTDDLTVDAVVGILVAWVRAFFGAPDQPTRA